MNFFKNGFIEKIDSKVNPETGKFCAKFFKIFTLVISILGVVIISVIFGSIVLGSMPAKIGAKEPHFPISVGLALSVFIPWIVITLTSSSLWFYFSKWNG